MARKALLTISAVSLVACVATPATRFPDFDDRAKTIESVDVLLNVMVGEEGKQFGLGIDLERNRRIADSLRAEIEWTLRAKGYRVQNLHVNGGLFVDWNELAEKAAEAKADELKRNLVGKNRDASEASAIAPESAFVENEYTIEALAEDRSTGETVNGPFLDPGAQPWSSSETMKFLRTVRQQAIQYYYPDISKNEISADPSSISPDRPSATEFSGAALFPDMIPEAVSGISSDKLLIISVKAIEVRSETSTVVGFSSGFLSLLLSGGTLIAVTSIGDGHVTEAILVDIKNEEILWYNNVRYLGNEADNYTLGLY